MPPSDKNGVNKEVSQKDLTAAEEQKMRARLDRLKTGLDKATSSQNGGRHDTSPRREKKQSVGKALRLGTEFIAGVAIGGLIGYWIDLLAGTKPLWFVVFFLLGTAAGFLNVFRTARQLQAEQAEQVEKGQLDLGNDMPVNDDDED